MMKIKCLILVFAVIVLVLCIMIFYYTGSNIISNKIVDWQIYGQTLYSWLGLCLMVINILVVVLLNGSVNKLSINLNKKSIEAEKEKLKAQLRYENFVSFKKDWDESYTVLKNNADNDNQRFFDLFKEIFYKYVNNDRFLEKNIFELNTVKWWTAKLNSIDNFYKTNANFDTGNASIEMSPKIQELYMELANNIFEYAQEKES